MDYYYLECDNCDEETQVSLSSGEEPTYCPMCGAVVNAQLIDGEED